MKKLKIALFSLITTLFLVTSCTNDEPVNEDPQQTEDSQSISTALGELRTHFDQNGNVTQTDNPAGNIVLDFCFDFVYPLTLSYNNGTTVTVEDLDGLIDVLLASTDELYIDGIAFPFDVETFDDDSDAIEVVTINDEEEFIDLIEDCDFDDFETCECFEVYDPVCVEITDPSGQTFVVTYPNECYAECDGFDDNDFIEDCEDDYNPSGDFECFDLNFPLSVITEDGDVIVINSEEELGTVLYDEYIFDFVYPFTVTLYNDEEEIITINSAEDFEDILEDCYDNYDDDFEECDECEDEPINPICIEYIDDDGNTILTVLPNMCYVECLGFNESNVVECDDNTNPSDCSEDYIESVFDECQTWEATVSGQVFDYLFSDDDILEIYDQDSNLVASGTWEITVDGGSGAVVMIIDTNSDNFTTVWFFINCDPVGNFEVITNGGAATDVSSTCD